MLIEDLLEHLRDANTKLESIVKELDNYLEKKREHFARFYFLSNDDLLEILSQTKEPTAVQPHLKKVFENIKEVEFNDGKRIVAMQSAEGEKIVFPAPVNPNEKNVEDWMQDLEDAMKLAVKKELTTAVKAYTQLQRTQWVR
jgi:dynein heavy chain